MKCFVDANVLFSGANEASQMHRFLIKASEGHQLISSDYAHHSCSPKNSRILEVEIFC